MNYNHERQFRERVLVILIAGIGDMILASKAIRALRNGLPHAQIHVLTSTEAAVLAEEYSFIDYVWSFPVRELRRKRGLHILKAMNLLKKLRNIQFDKILNLYWISSWAGSLKMGIIFMVLRGKVKIGHNHKGFRTFINVKVDEGTFQGKHMADAMTEVVLLAGGKADGKGLEVYYDDESVRRWSPLFSKFSRKTTIGINPGGDRLNRRWAADNYAAVARNLSEKMDARIILLGGPGEESISRYIQRRIGWHCISLAGKLNLKNLVYIISQLDLLVTNDSGPMHVAAAVKTPIVAIFGPEDPRLFGPYTKPGLFNIVYKESLECRPCRRKKCDRPYCLDLITPDEVFRKCIEMLKNVN